MARLKVELRPYRLRFRVPFRTAVGTFRVREGIVVRVGDGAAQGCGEAAPLPGFSAESLTEVREALERWAPLDPGDSLDAAAFEALPGPAAARHGAEQALLGLVAARRGCTVAHLLAGGRPVAEQVSVNGLARDPSEAKAAVARGMRCLKIKVGAAPLDADLRRVRAIRAAVGPGVALRLDANQAWEPAVARRAIEALAPLGIELLEEPVADLQQMAALRGQVPLGADETVAHAGDLERVIALGAADVVVIKPMRVGSLRSAAQMLRRAEEAGLQAVITTSLEGAIGRWGALAVAATGPVLACGLDTGHLLMDEPWPGFTIREGQALLGAGVPSCR